MGRLHVTFTCSTMSTFCLVFRPWSLHCWNVVVILRSCTLGDWYMLRSMLGSSKLFMETPHSVQSCSQSSSGREMGGSSW